MADVTYTPTQKRILAVLSDGLPHTRDELMRCLNDDMAEEGTLKAHIQMIRNKLRPIGQNIISECHGRGSFFYRLTRLISVSE